MQAEILWCSDGKDKSIHSLTKNIKDYAFPELKKLRLHEQLETIQKRNDELSYAYMADNCKIQ